MRRTSKLATEISCALRRAEIMVSARRLEGWDLEGLGPDRDLPVERQVAHYRALADVSGPGRGRNADLAARRLAAHGFVCSRLRGALLRGLNIAEVGQPQVPIDLSTDESGDAAFEKLDEIAQAMIDSLSQVPMPLRGVVEKGMRNAREIARRTGDSADGILRSAIVNFLCLLLGGDIYDAGPLAALFGVDPSEVHPEVVDFVNEHLRITAWDIDEAYRSVPVAAVATMAAWLRARAHLAAPLLELEAATDTQLDDLAAIYAPYVLYILAVVAPRFHDAPELVATLGLPVELLPPSLATPALSA